MVVLRPSRLLQAAPAGQTERSALQEFTCSEMFTDVRNVDLNSLRAGHTTQAVSFSFAKSAQNATSLAAVYPAGAQKVANDFNC
jgi:hypothetical protein